MSCQMPNLPIELDAEEMMNQIQQFNAANLRAMQHNKWEDFSKNREKLESWFISKGIKLISKEA